jgi:hypothetical protein
MTMNTATAPLAHARTESRYFYLWMAGIYLLIAFGGFTPTYWAPVATGHFKGAPILHIHGMLLFTWTVFFFVQSALVAGRRVMDHRAWGLAGISLFTLLMCSILIAQEMVLKRDSAAGFADGARQFAAVTLIGWPVLVLLFILAIRHVKQPELHKRYMTLLMANMMTPAVARVFITVIAALHPAAGGSAAPPPPFVAVPPSLVGDLLIVAAMIYDWRTQGRVHKIYIWGGIFSVVYPILIIFIAPTSAWASFVIAFQSLTG